MIKLNIKLDLDRIPGKMNRAMDFGQYVLDNEVLKDSNYYAPQDQSELINSAIRHSQPGEGQIQWVTPYARRLYYNPQYNFSKDMNPHASGLWFEVAKSTKLQDWIALMQKAVNKEL